MRMNRRRRPPILKIGLGLLALLLVAYVGVSIYVADKLSHPTRRALTTNPAEYSMKFEDVTFNSTVDNVPLKGWYIEGAGVPSGTTTVTRTIVLMHGRNSTKDNRTMMEVGQDLNRRGYGIFLFDFRAHGASGGERYSLGPWETRDVAGALAYLKGRGIGEVGAVGYSMGASTEILAAPDHPEMKALVVDSPFADLEGLLGKELPKSSGLPSFFNPGILLSGQLFFGLDLLGNKPVRQFAQLKDRPIFLIHGDADQLVPVSQAYDFQRAAEGNPNFQFWVVPGAAHVGAYDVNKQEYLTRLSDFFGKYLLR